MPRHARAHATGGLYHVTARGNNRQRVFLDVPDHQVFMAMLAKVRSRFGWACLSYCLMGNHYHVLVACGPETIGDGMRTLNGTFAAHFNRRYERSGHVWQDRYHSEPVRCDRQVLATLRYIAANPVAAGFCDRPEHWIWSAHRALAGARDRDVVAVEHSLRYLHDDLRVARRLYLKLVGTGPGGLTIGDGEEPDLWRPPIARILGWHSRDLAVAVANLDYGYSLREIADEVGCHHSTVERWLAVGRQERRADATGTVPVARGA